MTDEEIKRFRAFERVFRAGFDSLRDDITDDIAQDAPHGLLSVGNVKGKMRQHEALEILDRYERRARSAALAEFKKILKEGAQARKTPRG